jgi:hypothetical protein
VVVNAVEVGAFGALEGGAVDVGAMAVVTAVVTGLGPGGFVQGEKEDLGRVAILCNIVSSFFKLFVKHPVETVTTRLDLA